MIDRPVTCVAIKHKTKVLFEQLAIGEPFLLKGCLFVKTSTQSNKRNPINAIGIGNQKQYWLLDDVAVSCVNVEATEL